MKRLIVVLDMHQPQRRTLTWVRGLKRKWNVIKKSKICRTLTWVRGLKRNGQIQRTSHFYRRTLTWVRGLKHLTDASCGRARQSHPYMGAWIETSMFKSFIVGVESRTLTWVRGLKHIISNIGSFGKDMSHPYMGAWIETTDIFENRKE